MLSELINKARNRFAIERRECHRWARASSYSSGPRVFYGLDQWFKPGEIVSGGIVKILDLQEIFPNSPSDPNLLYLVSSALPPYADRMVWWAKTRGAKVVLNQNGVAYPAWHGQGWEAANRIPRHILRSADYVFYQSLFCKQTADQFLGHRADRFEILLNPVDTALFIPAPDQPLRRMHTLLLAGTHYQFYRVQCAIETLAILARHQPNARMVLAGKNCWRPNPADADQELRALARQWNVEDRIDFTGPYTQEQAVGLFHRAGVLLHTKYNDPCPRLVSEALACGLPVVYSASGGVPELVGATAGIGIPAPLDLEKDHPPAPAQLANAVMQVWSQYGSYTTAARSQALATLNVQAWQKRHQSIFNALINTAQP
jgi:glycosyltransferase involved in cell wall biosynthesis